MKTLFFIFLSAMGITAFGQKTSYEQTWDALNKNDRAGAARLLKAAMADPATANDAFITNIYLQSYNGQEATISDFESAFYKKASNPYPYLYALWFNKAVLGDYGKKSKPWQLSLLDKLINDQQAPGSIVAAANYQKAMHLIFSAEQSKAESYGKEVGNLQGWQFTGPFENLSESGIYKDYGALQHPEPDYTFKSMTHANVKWFAPSDEIKTGWTLLNYNFSRATAVIYAQTFVNSSAAREVICNAGFTGAIKVWINDELVLQETKELTTELDFRSVKYNLKAGTNRILVQLSYTNINTPNFSIRLTDNKYHPIPELSGSPVYAHYPKSDTKGQGRIFLPHFAEEFFLTMLAKEPGNLLNYILLSDFYYRNSQFAEARTVINKALAAAPDNSLLRSKLINILARENSRQLQLEEIERLKKDDPESLFALTLKINELHDGEKYEECEKLLNRRIELYGEDESTAGIKVLLLLADQKFDDLVKYAEVFYKMYPDNARLVEMMYNIKKEVHHDKKGAMKLLADYLSKSYDYETYNLYANALIDGGDQKRGLAYKEKLSTQFPYSPDIAYNMANYYYATKQYSKAEKFLSRSLSLAPYSERYWELAGDIQREQDKKENSIQSYNRALELDPNQYTLIGKIRKMNGLPEVSKLFETEDILSIIANDDPEQAMNTDYGYYYILDRKDAVLYRGGANEQFITLLIRITNEKGIERYKESSIGYNRSENLLIESAQVIKPNKSRLDGEKNGNEIVFSNLEAGDVIYFKYRLQDFSSGRLGLEFWDQHHFTGRIYSARVSYNLLVPNNQKIIYKLTESTLQPQIKPVEDFRMYSWVMNKGNTVGDEPLMPLMVDVASVLHISTMDNWDQIAVWYSDALTNKSEENIEILSLYNSLFPDSTRTFSEFRKARIIYDYIANNIKYSSVSFRQGPLIPQRASATLTTRLGDCKDLSNLFVVLAHMAGINAQMVLVDTRDNGTKDILMPSMEFNHCIAKVVLDGKPYYIELTDNYLPFASFPNYLNGAIGLEIPSRSMQGNNGLVYLSSPQRTKDVIRREINISAEGSDLKLSVQTMKSGALTSSTRADYKTQSEEKQRQQMEQSMASGYKNSVKLDYVKFDGLSDLSDSITYTMSLTVKNEINEIGSMRTFKLSYPDIIATLDNFAADKRIYPIEYWNYENVDEYETTINITTPAGTKFTDLPKNEDFKFRALHFSISYHLKPNNELQVVRRFTNDRPQQISAEEYPAFKAFFENILKAEQKFLVYK